MTADGILSLQPGALFSGRYRVVRRIKAGGMGAVYEVVDERTDGPRALKVMLPSMVADRDLRARFALEAKVTGNIVSDHLVRVSDAGIDEPTETPFLVMELLHGLELGSLLDQRGPLPPGEVVLYLHQAALALDKTHAAGIVHRDLKPENLFVTYRDDGSPCLKILDFGIAKVVAQSTARMTRAMGTPIYMSPEQVRGEATIGSRSDLFTLGHIAYTLLAGEAYWSEEMKSVDSVFPLLTKIVAGMPEAPSARCRRRRGVVLPAAFDGWMARASAGPVQDRFDRATAQVAALAEALGVAGMRAALPSMGPMPVSAAPSGWPPVQVAPSGPQGAGQTQVLSPSSLPAPTENLSPSGPQGYSTPVDASPSGPQAPVPSSVSAPSLPGSLSGPQPAGTVVAMVSTAAPPRTRSPVPWIAAGVGVAIVATVGFVALRPSGPPASSAVLATVEAPRTAVPVVPTEEPMVAPSGVPAVPSAEPTASASVVAKPPLPPTSKGTARPAAPTVPRAPSAPPRFSTPL